MASTSNTLVSSSFLGTNLHLSPPTPKTSNSNLLLLSLSKRKSQTTTKSILNNTNENKNNSFYLKNLPSQAALAALIFSSISQTTLSALAIDTPPPPPQQQVIEAEAIQSSSPFSQNLNLTAPKPQSQSTSDLPDGTQWRYSEFLNAVKKGKVERVRFSKDGGVLQLSAVDGRRASVIVPNDPDLIDILAMNGVDISVSEGETGNGLFNFIGNLLFPVLAFAGLFFLFRRQGGPGGPGGLGGPMDFGRSKSKFQEVPETGVHSRGKSLAKDVDFEKVARRTPGFTGADLQNLMNEAAILAARRDLKEISKDEISDALERIIAGPEKKNAVVSEEKKKLVAYHEAGHALVGALMPEYDPVAKISIIPRGQAGGLTFFAPSEERLESGLYSRSYLENQMAVALGGRVAEEVIFGQDNVTTGASNDFMQVSRVARQMVERFGFSKKIGQVAIGGGGGNPFLGQQMSSQKDYSMATADVVDSEVRELVDKAYTRATQIITTHIDILHKLAQLLIEKETVDGEEFMSLFIDGKAELFVA
ncbi:Atp-dependent zinc metalloprotease ftsh [Thalictrum thalictroides]|uniref:Atp-dependent zinc metalloprotease ftsh n=2 Tax=Thalictrum thalictroides TaxID=46969 RepID=A0A7J6V4B6_THATH|nr:Atp-dependent zinc metalloprotease ftsh [Thalictrum thalictroides]